MDDVRFEVENGLAWITIDRQDRLNAFRAKTVDELIGSFDAGYGSAYLARVVGEKRAREIWFLCRRYDAETAERWGLVNRVVPAAELRAEVRRWADDILKLSPTALRFLKQSFNSDTEHLAGVGQLAFSGLGVFVDTDEAREGINAFAEKREPDFSGYRELAST